MTITIPVAVWVLIVGLNIAAAILGSIIGILSRRREQRKIAP